MKLIDGFRNNFLISFNPEYSAQNSSKHDRTRFKKES